MRFEKLRLGEEFRRFGMAATTPENVEGITEAEIELERTHRSLGELEEKEEMQHA